MESLYENSMFAIESLQSSFPQQKGIFFMISNIFDPRYAFLVYAPILYALDSSSGKKLMWVSVLAEWSNQILKWMLRGERPYWWVHEAGIYNRTGNPTPAIQQYFMTCETGPGSPSGHAMVTAAVWYVLIESLLKKVGAINKNSKHLASLVCWSSYLFMLCCVSASRVFIAAHFPHQCALGMIIGFGFAMNMERVMATLERLNLRHYILSTGLLLFSALATFVVLRAMGINPMWSVDRAVKWCARQEYIHMDTTPFFSMMRYCGFLLGMGLAFNSDLYMKLQSPAGQPSIPARIFTAFLCLIVAKLSEQIDLPKSNNQIFYGTAFLLNALLPFLFIAVLPHLTNRLWGRRTNKKVN